MMSIADKFIYLIDRAIEGFFRTIGVHDMEDVSDFEEEPINRESENKDVPNLFVGKEIGDHVLKGRVISFDDDGIEMEIIELNDPHGRYGRYMDVGKRYPMFRHKYWTFDRGLMLWEVDPKSMKRDVSQILLQWEKDIGWTWDLDM